MRAECARDFGTENLAAKDLTRLLSYAVQQNFDGRLTMFVGGGGGRRNRPAFAGNLRVLAFA